MEDKKEDIKKKEKLSKEEIKRQKKEQKEAKKREEKVKKEEQKRLKKEQKAKEKERRNSLKMKPSKISGHMKLQSSGQILPSNIHRFGFIKTELPESFFEDLLLKEMELSEEFTIEKLTTLITLYSQAMEHYLPINPSKAKDYQSRLEYLLTNKDTLKKLKKQSENLKVNKNQNNNQLNLEKQDSNTKINTNKTGNNIKDEIKKNIEYKTDNLMFDDILDKVNEVIEDSNAKGNVQITKNLIENDIEKQNMSWKEKLKNKKRGKLRNSMIPLGKKKLNLNLTKSRYKNMNDGEGSDEENDKNENEDNINIIFEDFNIMNNDDNDNKKEQIIDNFEEINVINENENEYENLKEKNVDKNKKINEKEKKIEEQPRKKSIMDKDVIRSVDIDEKILTSVNQKMDLLMKLIEDIEKNKLNDDEDDENLLNNIEKNNLNNNNDNNIIIEEKKENKKLSESQTNIINVPIKFQSTYYQVESIMQSYMDEFNNLYYKDIFEQFSSGLKEIYDNKYKKYIDISIEYHNQIKENEHILENNDNLSEEKKIEIQQIIDSLKDEQQNQIAKIEDEFNRLIVSKVNEFKINSFKNNSGIQLLEEQLKLDIYSLINESFY